MSRAFSLIVLASFLALGCTSPRAQTRMTPPPEELAVQLHDAIWRDILSNAWIGNGNELAARWANARREGEEAPSLYIQNLLCVGDVARLRCRFGLFREGGVANYLGRPAPERLACAANFLRFEDEEGEGWRIPRLPPRRGGHSRITIACRPAP
ncbi:MAG: hypothetical protein ACK4K7_02925 [Allosphingosinicella sp.]|uniref:hypothetical protein n=1 Tax=Allosphingosinicella sp. TaxID=2823234 RepID=UPI0039456B7A